MTVHINRPAVRYYAQIRKEGSRLWKQADAIEHTTVEDALKAVAANMKGMKRGRVLMVPVEGWYGPTVIMEVNRK